MKMKLAFHYGTETKYTGQYQTSEICEISANQNRAKMI